MLNELLRKGALSSGLICIKEPPPRKGRIEKDEVTAAFEEKAPPKS